MDRIDRRNMIAEDWRTSGQTYREVSERYGITRERVRQIVNLVYGPDAVQDRQSENRELRKLARAMERPLTECIICGARIPKVPSYKHQSCCPEHAFMWTRIRHHVAEYRERHRINVAKWHVAHPEKVNGTMFRSAQRHLDGTVGYHGRWLVESSVSHSTATQAYREGWPIFERLVPEIQDQIRSEESELRHARILLGDTTI